MRFGLLLTAAFVGPALSSAMKAQGIASAALGGRVMSASGSPVADAQLVLTNTATGTINVARAAVNGQFRFENVPIGRYRLDARSIGWQPVRIDGIDLHLGDRAVRDVVMSAVATELEGVIVTESALRDAGAGGPAYFVPGEAVRRLPLRDRNFVGLLAMAAQATGSGLLSIGGQSPRFNAIQVDGGSSGDFFGVNITPGANAGAKVISLEALEEIRILVAPFDVRQGGFSGGLINAATRSGTNEFRGSAFATHSRPSFVGADTGGAAIETFQLLQYGARVGGPLVRDRLHFFVVADLQVRDAPFVGPVVADPSTGISAATADRAARAFREQYGFDPGTADPPLIGQPNRNVFAKLSWQPSSAHQVELTHSNVSARTDVVNRTSTNDRGWQLSGSGYALSDHTVTTRLKVLSAKGRLSNELVTSAGSVDDRLKSHLEVPLFLVQGDSLGRYLAGGSAKNATSTETSHRVMELTDNLSWSHGSHLFTIGTQNQLVHVHDSFFLGSWGVWTFDSVDALERRAPSRYEVALPLRPGGPLAAFSALQVAGYVQDRWTPTSDLALTLGLRVDAPFIEHPAANPQLAANDALGRIDTGDFPTGNAQLAPRFGFTWDVDGKHTTSIRGGIGTFTGRPLYVWLATAFANTGLDQTLLICGPQHGVPAPTTSVNNLPSRCLNDAVGTAVSTVSVFAPSFRFQQAVKLSLGVDRQIPGGVVVSLDALHSRSRDQAYMTDANVVERGVNAEGRMMYGSISAGGATRTTRRDSVSFGPVYQFSNASGDRFTSVTGAIQKSWEGGGMLHAGYAWSRTMDLMTISGFNGPIILQNAPIDGTLASRALRRSLRDIPHNLSASAVVPAGAGVILALFARARSGTPFAWSVNGDANADSSRANDLMYVPRDSADVSLSTPQAWATLDAFIESERCLREQRGRVVERGSCRNPSVAALDASLSRVFSRRAGNGIEVRADVFNLPNLLRNDWGLVHETTPTEAKNGPLAVSGWDAANNRPRYRVPSTGGVTVLPGRDGVVVDASRWRAQLSVRIDF